MKTPSVRKQDDSRFSLRTLFVVVAVCALAAFVVRVFMLRAQGRAHWAELATAASHEPSSLKTRVDDFLKLKRRGRAFVPSRDFMVDELIHNRNRYLDRLERMDAAAFVDAIEQHNYMKTALNLNVDGIPEYSQEPNIDTLTGDIGWCCIKVIKATARKIATEQEEGIALPNDSRADLNKLIEGLALMKNKLPEILWDFSRESYRGTLPQDASWKQTLRGRGVPSDIRPVLEPIILHDLEMILADDQTLSTRLSQPMLEAYKQRAKILRWLCEYSEDEFVIPEAHNESN